MMVLVNMTLSKNCIYYSAGFESICVYCGTHKPIIYVFYP